VSYLIIYLYIHIYFTAYGLFSDGINGSLNKEWQAVGNGTESMYSIKYVWFCEKTLHKYWIFSSFLLQWFSQSV